LSVTTIDPALGSACRQIRDQIASIVVAEDDVLEPILVALIARGHVLIEGIPGTGKTLLARTLARVVGLDFHRIQFTNDLMPSDIVGSSVWRRGQEEFVFVPGPIFANVVLADEINRTSPRTLSCLLEAMEAGSVSIEGKSTSLADPFFVLATRNPIEFHGTYPVPEAALDRFMLRVHMHYPDVSGEIRLYLGENPEERLESLEAVVDREALVGLQQAARRVEVSEQIAGYAYKVVAATRVHEATALGVSPRGAMVWIAAARARALIQGRGYVLPDDLKALAGAVLTHRIFLKGGGGASGVVRETIEQVPVVL
jgi:MoxR-like ATPase